MPPIQRDAASVLLPCCIGGRSSGRGSKFLAGISILSGKGSDASTCEAGLGTFCLTDACSDDRVGKSQGSLLCSSHRAVEAVVAIRCS
jgi:hypothetical protein